MKQGGRDAIGEKRRGEIIQHRAEHELRLVEPAALEHRHAGEALQHLVEATLLAERPLVAVTGQPGINEARVELFEARIIDAEASRHRGPEILDQHIGALDHAVQDRQPLLLLQIEGNGALTAIGPEKEASLTRQAGGELAEHVALRRLDLDDVGAEIGEQGAAIGTGEVAAEIEHRDAAERSGGLSGHARRSCSRIAAIFSKRRCAR